MSPLASQAEKIVKAATDAGHPIPEDCIAPELPDDCRFVYAAFNELRTDRQIGMGVGPIPFSSIDRYCDRYGIFDIDEFDRFVLLIRAMERAADKAKSD